MCKFLWERLVDKTLTNLAITAQFLDKDFSRYYHTFEHIFRSPSHFNTVKPIFWPRADFTTYTKIMASQFQDFSYRFVF